MIVIIFDNPLQTASQIFFSLPYIWRFYFPHPSNLIYFSFWLSRRVAFSKAEMLANYTHVYKPQLRKHHYLCIAKSISGFYRKYNRRWNQTFLCQNQVNDNDWSAGRLHKAKIILLKSFYCCNFRLKWLLLPETLGAATCMKDSKN